MTKPDPVLDNPSSQMLMYVSLCGCLCCAVLCVCVGVWCMVCVGGCVCVVWCVCVVYGMYVGCVCVVYGVCVCVQR